MDVYLEEIEKKSNELFFKIIDRDTNQKVGILFTVGNHIAFEVYEKFQGQGAATDALKIITSRIPNPVLEITYNNVASKKVALKAGYVFQKRNPLFDIYEYSPENKINK